MQVIYDNTGYIYLAGEGFPEPQGIPFLNVEIPEGKLLKSIDVSSEPHKPVFEDIPKSEMEILKEKVAQLEANDEALLSGIGSVTGGVL